MADTNEGTAPAEGEAQSQGEQKPETGTPVAQDEVTTLRSRNAGLDAKVTELSKAAKAAAADRDAALAKLQSYEAGKVGADEALRAQIAAKEAELAAVRQEAALARIEAKYPETFALLGDAAANLSADKLAEAEARFKGVAAPETPAPAPKPIGNNPSRQASSATEETFESIAQRLSTMTPPWKE
jgi:hypothetical protein